MKTHIDYMQFIERKNKNIFCACLPIRFFCSKLDCEHKKVPKLEQSLKEMESFLTEITSNVYPSIVTYNKFLEINFSQDRLKLSFVELEVLIKILFPTFSYGEVLALRLRIVDILKIQGFTVKRFRVNLHQFNTIWVALFTQTQNRSDNIVYGFRGLCLKNTIIEKIFNEAKPMPIIVEQKPLPLDLKKSTQGIMQEIVQELMQEIMQELTQEKMQKKIKKKIKKKLQERTNPVQ
jgi:hypothetical protein